MSTLTKLPNKVRHEILDYTFDYRLRLDTGDRIVSAELLFQKNAGLVLDSIEFTDTTVIFWLSGGTVGQTAEFTVEATTVADRVIGEEAQVFIAA